MTIPLLIGAIVVLVCIITNKISNKIGIPVLLGFIGLGMLFGSDGIFKISAISEKCGFSSSYNFSRFFKNKTGITPTEYLKQNKIHNL